MDICPVQAGIVSVVRPYLNFMSQLNNASTHKCSAHVHKTLLSEYPALSPLAIFAETCTTNTQHGCVHTHACVCIRTKSVVMCSTARCNKTVTCVAAVLVERQDTGG